MAILDDITEQEVAKNKAIRGYIIRAWREATRTRSWYGSSPTRSSRTG